MNSRVNSKTAFSLHSSNHVTTQRDMAENGNIDSQRAPESTVSRNALPKPPPGYGSTALILNSARIPINGDGFAGFVSSKRNARRIIHLLEVPRTRKITFSSSISYGTHPASVSLLRRSRSRLPRGISPTFGYGSTALILNSAHKMRKKIKKGGKTYLFSRARGPLVVFSPFFIFFLILSFDGSIAFFLV